MIGIDVRVVPDMYDGLAWNARVEYIGQFPTIPLHRKILADPEFRSGDTDTTFIERFLARNAEKKTAP